jgi:dTDP-4-amino-4,6-dideoxygalactose transaminase
MEHLGDGISPQMRAVCYVKYSGHTGGDLAEISRERAARRAPMIEDAAGSLGHHYNGRAAGAFGTIGAHSFGAPKSVTTGQGGVIVSHDQNRPDKAAAFVDYCDLERRKINVNREVGTTLRFTDIQASLGLSQFRDLEARLAPGRTSFGVQSELSGAHLYRAAGSAAFMTLCVPHGHMISPLNSEGAASTPCGNIEHSQHLAYADLRKAYPSADRWTDHAVYLSFSSELHAWGCRASRHRASRKRPTAVAVGKL